MIVTFARPLSLIRSFDRFRQLSEIVVTVLGTIVATNKFPNGAIVVIIQILIWDSMDSYSLNFTLAVDLDANMPPYVSYLTWSSVNSLSAAT